MGHLIFVAIFSSLPCALLMLNYIGTKQLKSVFRTNIVLGALLWGTYVDTSSLINGLFRALHPNIAVL